MQLNDFWYKTASTHMRKWVNTKRQRIVDYLTIDLPFIQTHVQVNNKLL